MPLISTSLSWLSILGLLFSPQSCLALSKKDRLACQKATHDPLKGCPKHTSLVDAGAAKNLTKTKNVFSSIQSAVLSLPHDNSTQYILILPGQYTEQVNVTRPGPLYLLGQTNDAVSLAKNTVEVIWHNATGTATTGSYDNAWTSTLTIAPTFNSSTTGAGPTGNPVPENTPFGNFDFRAYNLNFTNDYLPYSAGPSLALSTSYANTGFYHCSFKSYQDTVYVGKLANSYMSKCEIAGQTDFLYGFGTLWIEDSDLLMRSCGGGITAWKGTNTTYENKFGVYIHDSNVVAANSSIASTMIGKCALGRPWNAQHRSIFANTYLDASIKPSGYISWGTTDPRVSNLTNLAEYMTYGPGWNKTGRAQGGVTRVLTERQWQPYSSPAKVFQFFKSGKPGNTAWVDWNA
jgi:pectin methylesterase-like acyl-CoA thioesterase